MHKDSAEIIAFLKNLAADELKTPLDLIDENATFHELGFDSISCVYLLEKLETEFEIQLSPLHFWDYPTIKLLGEQVKKELK